MMGTMYAVRRARARAARAEGRVAVTLGDEAVAVGVRGSVSPAVSADLAVDVGDMSLDGWNADGECASDLAVCLARGDQTQDLDLAPWDEQEGVLRFSLNTARQKVKNLRKRPEASFLILDPASPYRTLELRGRVELEADDDYAFAGQLGKKYGGADLKAMDGSGQTRVKATLRPVKANTWGE